MSLINDYILIKIIAEYKPLYLTEFKIYSTLSYQTIHSNIKELLKRGFIIKEEHFNITSRGNQYLLNLNKIMNIVLELKKLGFDINKSQRLPNIKLLGKKLRGEL